MYVHFVARDSHQVRGGDHGWSDEDIEAALADQMFPTVGNW